MQLKLKNIAKLKEAAINIDGITVIAGENNTGKSTIGKLLFSIFNSMNNMNQKIEQEKQNKVFQIVSLLLQDRVMHNAAGLSEYRRKSNLFSRKFAEGIIKFWKNTSGDDVEYYVEHFVKDFGLFKDITEEQEFINECIDKLKTINNISDEKVMLEVITRWFNRVFENQISPLTEQKVESEIDLVIKGKEINYIFKENACVACQSQFNILHEAFYVDNPFIVDYMSDRFVNSNMKTTDIHLLRYLCKEEGDIFAGVFDAVMAKDKLDEIYGMLGEIVGGDIIETSEGEYCLKSNKYSNPINIKNLSTGLKSFALVKMLLEKGSLKEKDILILDEPEIHLHPEWQLMYAKMIVLLQKKFDLTMIITTHSPYFLDAIDVFTAKYEISDKVNYYLAENEEEVSYLHNVTNNIDAIYKKLSDPMQKLENIRNGIDIDEV